MKRERGPAKRPNAAKRRGGASTAALEVADEVSGVVKELQGPTIGTA